MCVCKRAWAKECVSSSLSNSSSNRFSPSNDSDNVCTPHQSSLNWFGLLRNSIFPFFLLSVSFSFVTWIPDPRTLFFSPSFSPSPAATGRWDWESDFSRSLPAYNLSITLIFCKAALLPSRRKEKRQGSERKEEKERGRELRGWGAGGVISRWPEVCVQGT